MKKIIAFGVIFVTVAVLLALRPLLRQMQPPAQFEVVATKRVSSAEDSFHMVNFRPNETGLAVILKRASSRGETSAYSTDFALAFEELVRDISGMSAKDIPRRPCLGISYGMKSPNDEIRWAVVGESLSRHGIEAGAPYFAILFSAPREVNTFSLYRTVAFSRPFVVKPLVESSTKTGP